MNNYRKDLSRRHTPVPDKGPHSGGGNAWLLSVKQTLQNTRLYSWNIAKLIVCVKTFALWGSSPCMGEGEVGGVPCGLALIKSSCQIIRLWIGFCVVVIRDVSKHLGVGVPRPFGWRTKPTTEIHRLDMVGHHAKFSSYNDWSVEITGVNILGALGAPPLG